MANNEAVLKMNGVCKTFPGVKALKSVDFKLRAGEIHALMGENGAGKSTLIKVLTGVEELDSGEIYLSGEKILAKSTQQAQELGISTVYQEVNLCPNLTVAENFYIGREPTRYGKINWKEINRSAEQALAKLDLKIDVKQKLENYSVAIQQMVAIARAIDYKARVLILDEPTSSLDKNEVEKLFIIMKKLRSEGMGIIFVTHFLDQVYEVSDRITVLRNGELVGEYEAESLPKIQLVAKMIGKDLDILSNLKKDANKEQNTNANDTFMSFNGVGHTGTIEPFDLEIRKGEVLGLAGLLGSGRSELARVIFGIDKADSGEIRVNDERANIASPIDAIKRGIALCPENRKTEGIIGELSVRENIILALQARNGIGKTISRKEQERIADEYIKLLNIKTSGKEQLVKNLSGGNQQKVILARWLATNPDLLILDEPTRGIDVGTKTEIQKLIIQFAERGMSVVFISSEMDESLRCCSRMAILRDGRKVAEICEDELTDRNVMKSIAGED